MSYTVYILESEKDGSFYIGQTNDLEKRLQRHNRGYELYTRTKLPWKVWPYSIFPLLRIIDKGLILETK